MLQGGPHGGVLRTCSTLKAFSITNFVFLFRYSCKLPSRHNHRIKELLEMRRQMVHPRGTTDSQTRVHLPNILLSLSGTQQSYLDSSPTYIYKYTEIYGNHLGNNREQRELAILIFDEFFLNHHHHHPDQSAFLPPAIYC